MLPLYYATHDGHTRKVVAYLADRLAELGVAAHGVDLDQHMPQPGTLPPTGPIVLIAAIRYGFHLPAARAFIDIHKSHLMDSPVVMVSINLTARKPHKKTPTTNLYLRKWIRRSGLKPAYAAALAGHLDYPRYNWFDRTMIRLIMCITGGPTDPKTVLTYTHWPDVDRLAENIAHLCEPSRQNETPHMMRAS